MPPQKRRLTKNDYPDGMSGRTVTWLGHIYNFWDRVDRKNDHECWIWTGVKSHPGYGLFTLGSRQISAHRFSMWLFMGHDISRETLVCHDCPTGDNPSCVNPRHLFLGTAKDNMIDMVKKGRHSRRGPSKLSSAQAAEIFQMSKDLQFVATRKRSRGSKFEYGFIAELEKAVLEKGIAVSNETIRAIAHGVTRLYLPKRIDTKAFEVEEALVAVGASEEEE